MLLWTWEAYMPLVVLASPLHGQRMGKVYEGAGWSAAHAHAPCKLTLGGIPQLFFELLCLWRQPSALLEPLLQPVPV